MGHEPPESTVNDLWPASLPYWEAWMTLHASRKYAVGMGGGFPLGLENGAIADYAERRGYHDVRRDEFEQLVALMDGVFLKHTAEQSKAKGVR